MSRDVRLSDRELAVIVENFKKIFSKKDHLWLFGSRVYPEKRGGDLDLYIETDETELGKALKNKQRFIISLWEELGEQKIDLVLNVLTLKEEQPIYRVARQEGVFLA